MKNFTSFHPVLYNSFALAALSYPGIGLNVEVQLESEDETKQNKSIAISSLPVGLATGKPMIE